MPARKWDLMVGNPPYVLNREKAHIAKSVLAYEPHTAIFVPDHQPLIFYEKIAKYALGHLTTEGKLCLEINEALDQSVVALLRAVGLKQVEVHKDLQGKPRWVTSFL